MESSLIQMICSYLLLHSLFGFLSFLLCLFFALAPLSNVEKPHNHVERVVGEEERTQKDQLLY